MASEQTEAMNGGAELLKQCNITNSYYSEPLVCCVDTV